MIFRTHKKTDYTIICNHVFRNSSLSWKAKGLLAEMLSMPDNWVFSAYELIGRAKDGRDSLYSAIKELDDAGYIKRKRATNEKGQFIGYDYDVYETPITPNPETENPCREIPYTDNPPLLNTNNTNDIVSPNGDTQGRNNNPLEIKEDIEDTTPYNPPTQYSWLIEFWNKETAGSFKSITSIKGKRLDSVRARIKEYGSAQFKNAILRATNSDFLKGAGRQGFVLTFDWFIRPNNFPKVLEGNYDNQPQTQSQHGNNGHNQDTRTSDGTHSPDKGEQKRDYDFYGFGDSQPKTKEPDNGGWDLGF